MRARSRDRQAWPDGYRHGHNYGTRTERFGAQAIGELCLSRLTGQYRGVVNIIDSVALEDLAVLHILEVWLNAEKEIK